MSDEQDRANRKQSKPDKFREEVIRDFQVVMSTPNGRRFINRIRMFCNPDDSTFISGDMAFYRDGVQSVAKMLDAELTSTVELQESYLKMIIEAMNAKKETTNG